MTAPACGYRRAQHATKAARLAAVEEAQRVFDEAKRARARAWDALIAAKEAAR